MSEDPMKARRATSAPQVAILTILVVVGVLAATAIFFVGRDRLASTVASDGQDMSSTNLGLTAKGFGGPTAGTKSSPAAVAQIAAGLMTKALTYTPAGFDAQVAAAKKLMSVSMQGQYEQYLGAQNIGSLVKAGMSVTTTLVHYGGNPKNYAYLGVVSLTETSGEFVMLLQRSTTTTGSRQAQVLPVMEDVTLAKIGNTWVLSDAKNLSAPGV